MVYVDRPVERLDNRTRLEILRLIAELPSPVGANTLLSHLVQRGIEIGLDGVRYHLRVLDEQGFTFRVSTKGRILTDEGRSELRNSLVDTRMNVAVARIETLAHLVTFDPGSSTGRVVGALAVFPETHLPRVLHDAVRICETRFAVSNRIAVVSAGERFGRVIVPAGQAGLVMVGTAAIDGIILSRAVMFRPTFTGIVEVREWQPTRFVDVLEYGQGSRDPLEVLTTGGNTQVLGIIERGSGLIPADVREVPGVARERIEQLEKELRRAGMGGILAIGQVGQPVLGLPVRQHTFGIALAAGIIPAVTSYEGGVPVEFHCSEAIVDFSSLTPANELLAAL